MKKSTILLSAQDDALSQGLKAWLLGSGYRVIESTCHDSTLKSQQHGSPDLIILWASLNDAADALSLAQRIRRCNREIPLILITANSSEELAIAALKSGVNDYLKQPVSFEELNAAITRCLSSFVLKEKSAPPDTLSSALIGGEHMIGESGVLRDIKEYILKVAPTDSTVLVTGETGTGKELVAELIHNNSSRCQRPLMCINCAAIPDSLIESELFGHSKGAFTGAHSSQEGKLKLADAGTVFFDEIGDMSACGQAKILRTLESKEVYRLGGQSSTRVNVRVVAATNQDLEQLAAHGKFRKDLFFRLNVIRILLPPLRTRKEDIPRLLDYYIERFNHLFRQEVEGFDEETLQYLLRHDWPGNVRELKNLVEAIFVNRPSRRITVRALPSVFRAWCDNLQTERPDEREVLLSALFSTNWNKSKTAQKLHWSRMTVYRRMAKYHLTERAIEPRQRATSTNLPSATSAFPVGWQQSN